jgi:regulator of sigma E protease
MRVEKFSLFFGKPLWSTTRGETEYAIGWIPAGGYVKISGMDPREELPAEVLPRAYYRQKTWKRVFVIFAGPLVNIVLAFVIIFGVYATKGVPVPIAPVVGQVADGSAAAGKLEPGDRVISIDGVPGYTDDLDYRDSVRVLQPLQQAIGRHTCADGTTRTGCTAATPARITIERDGQRRVLAIAPRLTKLPLANGKTTTRPLLGITYSTNVIVPLSLGGALAATPRYVWDVTSLTAENLVKIFYDSEARKNIGSVAGAYDATRQTIEFSIPRALVLLGVVSLSLAIINLAPFLPLDGGHIFWAIAEKVRGRPIPFRWLERASVVGFVLVIGLFALGLTNDIGRFTSGGASVR